MKPMFSLFCKAYAVILYVLCFIVAFLFGSVTFHMLYVQRCAFMYASSWVCVTNHFSYQCASIHEHRMDTIWFIRGIRIKFKYQNNHYQQLLTHHCHFVTWRQWKCLNTGTHDGAALYFTVPLSENWFWTPHLMNICPTDPTMQLVKLSPIWYFILLLWSILVFWQYVIIHTYKTSFYI